MHPSARATATVYIGTFTTKGAAGIYIGRLEIATGALEITDVVAGVASPAFLALHPSLPYLYAVNEVREFAGQPAGGVSAFAIHPTTGRLALLNQQSSGGAGPCHLSVDATGRCVLVANYGGGSVAVLPIGADGSLGERSDFVQHHGSSVNPRRQDKPYAHSITPDPTNRCALACDLGADRVLVYRLDPAAGRLTPNATPWIATQPGAGPRHLAFHPNGRYLYAINELNSTLVAYAYDPEHGDLAELQTVSTTPASFTGENWPADVHVAASGLFVYGSNRGHDSIVIFAIDPATGQLSLVGHAPTEGRWPRNFALDPTGTCLLVANQESDSIVTFRLDCETGRLQPAGHVAEVPCPVCVRVLGLM